MLEITTLKTFYLVLSSIFRYHFDLFSKHSTISIFLSTITSSKTKGWTENFDNYIYIYIIYIYIYMCVCVCVCVKWSRFKKRCKIHHHRELVWFGFIAYQPWLVIYCQILFTHTYYIYIIYIIYIICKNISKQAQAPFCPQLNSFKYCSMTVTMWHQSFVFLTVCSIWPIYGTLSGAITPGQSGLGSNGNKGEFHIP